jgi:hypothetical protein
VIRKKKENMKKELLIDNDLVWQDPDTSLIWQKKVNDEEYEWDEAFEYAKKLNSQKFGGYDDWRLPTIDELVTLGNIKLYRRDDGNIIGENNPLNDYNTYDEWKESNWDKGYEHPNAHSGKNFIKEALLDSIKKQEYPWYWSSTSVAGDDSQAWVVLSLMVVLITLMSHIVIMLGVLEEDNSLFGYLINCGLI